MSLEPLPFDEPEDDPDTCPLCGGDWLICGCDPEEADQAWDQLGGDAA
jgi:hypothetical protein